MNNSDKISSKMKQELQNIPDFEEFSPKVVIESHLLGKKRENFAWNR